MNEILIKGNVESRNVYIGGRKLLPSLSQKVFNHSPDGFSWGYQGSGPAQLALAILLYYHSREFALMYYQDFKREVIASFPMDRDFVFSENQFNAWIDNRIKKELQPK